MVPCRKAIVTGKRFVKVFRLHQTQMLPRSVFHFRQNCGRQMIFVKLSGKSIAHLPVKTDLERQKQCQQRAVFFRVSFKIADHFQRSAFLLMQRVYLQRHQSAGRLHFSEKVHRKADQFHRRDQYPVLKKADGLHFPVFPQL